MLFWFSFFDNNHNVLENPSFLEEFAKEIFHSLALDKKYNDVRLYNNKMYDYQSL